MGVSFVEGIRFGVVLNFKPKDFKPHPHVQKGLGPTFGSI